MPSAIGRGSPASIRSTGRASSRRWSTTSPPRSRSARRTARSPSPCRPAISATSMPATSRCCMGLPIDRLVIATNVNDILARTIATGTYELREVVADLLAVDGHPGGVEFRAAAVRRLWPRRRRGARADGFARPVAAVRAVGARALGHARSLLRRPGRRRGDGGDDPHHAARDRPFHRSAYRRRRRGRREGNARSVGADGRAGDRARRQISRCRRGGLRRAAAAARMARRSRSAAGARHRRCRPIRAAVERHILSVSRAAHEGAAA